MKNILVAIDFEEQTDRLLDVVAAYAKAFKAKVWLVHIAAPDPDFIGYEPGPQYIRDARAEELREEHRQIQAYAQGLKDDGIDSDGLLIQGATIELIIEESEKLEADLIITGHHEHNALYKTFFHELAPEIIDNSKVPVLVVPLSEED